MTPDPFGSPFGSLRVPQNASSYQFWDNLDRKGPAVYLSAEDLIDVVVRPLGGKE